jgi:hypothetical protein
MLERLYVQEGRKRERQYFGNSKVSAPKIDAERALAIQAEKLIDNYGNTLFSCLHSLWHD